MRLLYLTHQQNELMKTLTEENEMKTLKELVTIYKADKLFAWSKLEDGRFESIGLLSQILFDGDDLKESFEEKKEYSEDKEITYFEKKDYKIYTI